MQATQPKKLRKKRNWVKLEENTDEQQLTAEQRNFTRRIERNQQ